MSTIAQITPEGWFAIVIALLVFGLYADHLGHALTDYIQLRGARRLRGLVIALLLAAGVLGIVMGTVARYVPAIADAARFVRWISVGMLFVGGITTFITWRWPGKGGND